MDNNKSSNFHDDLRKFMNLYVHGVYDISASFPKHELFGVTSQLQRSALSVILNYIEGYARQRDKVLKNFLEISYGSLQESKYLIEFSRERKYVKDSDCQELLKLGDKIGAML